jgi:hypothetical protein
MLRTIFKNNRGDTSGIGTAYLFGAPEFIPGFWSSLFNSIFSCMCMFFTSLFVPLYFFLLAIVLYVFLRLMNYDYPCGIFKLFLDINITFVSISLVQQLCWWTYTIPTVWTPSIRLDTVMVYYIYLLLQYTVPKKCNY